MRLLKIDSVMGASLGSLATSSINEPTLYVFGYGSLLWYPGFAYEQQLKARVHGYSRRFYQGNTTFRGTEEQPGRVVTLVEDEKSQTYGLVFKVDGWRNIFDSLEHLYEREIENGYSFRVVAFELLDSGEMGHALTCIALKQNSLFLGPSIEDKRGDLIVQRSLAWSIATARGTSGPNYEYLIKLATSMRELFPHVIDEDLFQLESFVISFLGELK